MSRVRTSAVLFVLWALQVSIFAHLRPFGVAPDLLLVGALVGGIVGGSEFGVRHGFFAGLLLDLVVPGPLGLAAGLYGMLGYATGLFSRSVDSEDPRVLPIMIGSAAFLATLAYGLGLGVLGSEQFVEWRLLWVAVAVAFSSIILVLPVRASYGWAQHSRPSGSARTEAPAGMVNS